MEQRHRESPRLPLPGGALQGTLSYSGAPGPAAVLYVHGFGSTRGGAKAEALEAACAARGWTFAAFDFRGHGQSSGDLLGLSGAALQEDLDAVRQYLLGRGARRLCLVGSSMGGWASAWFTFRHPDVVPACVLLAPALDFLGRRWEGLDETARRAWEETGRLRIRSEWLDVEVGPGLLAERGQFPLERLAARWATPALLFHGMGDDTVPYADSLTFVERTPYPHVELCLLRDGDHRLLAYRDEMAEAACRFFARRAGPDLRAGGNPPTSG
jgi:alpha-beta hydrolase superfamily lysophospholipase